ncbi:MAG: 30S ribosomal protein S16 [Candidatus Liptonbacteria bacterium]
MLIIRLQRIGKKHQPSYRLVVAEKRSRLIARPTEDLGSYNPSGKKASFKKDRISYWLSIGAQTSTTAHNLLVKEGIISGKKRAIKMRKSSGKKVEASAEPFVPAAAVPTE